MKDDDNKRHFIAHEVANLVRVPMPTRLLSLLIPTAYWIACFLILADFEATWEMKLVPIVFGSIQVLVGAFWEPHYRQNTDGLRLHAEENAELDPLSPSCSRNGHRSPDRVIDFGKEPESLPDVICFNRTNELLDSTTKHEDVWNDMM